MQIKICGITDKANMHDLAALRPDYLGFILYPPSPRDVSGKLDFLQLEELPAAIDKVAVVVDMPLEQVISLIDKYRFEAIQLHGNETPEYCRMLSNHCMVIKAFSIGDRLPSGLHDFEGACDLFLFDAAGEKRGGNGTSFDHKILKTYALKTPFMLSGGISIQHAAAIQTLAEELETLTGVDLNSRFEHKPGVKDIQLVKDFMNMFGL